MRQIIIFGDWVVDEYKFLVGYRSEISSSTGREHLRVRRKREDLCGAGHVARALSLSRRQYGFLGIGNWAKSDQAYIQALIAADDSSCVWEELEAFSIVPRKKGSRRQKIKLFPVSENGSTTVVTRVYRYSKESEILERRIDEESHKKPDFENLNDLPDFEDKVIIIVFDLRKGVVNSDSIAKLRTKYPEADWYVRSKNWDPEWIGELDSARLKLVFRGPEITSLKAPLDSWLYERTPPMVEPGRSAFDELREIGPAVNLLISESGSVLAIDRDREKWVGALPARESGRIQVGWSSSVFASATQHVIQEIDLLTKDGLQAVLTWAEENCRQRNGIPGGVPRHTNLHHGGWHGAMDAWEKATDSLGIISTPGGSTLELSRGMADLDGYVAIVEKRRRQIHAISRLISDFSRSKQSRPLSILLRSDPGGGKTSLARALSERFALQFIPSDVSQMLDRREIIELFEYVASLQTSSGRTALVFVDEINSNAWGNAYSSFLSVLEDGRFAVGRREYSLRPCVWLFAGTGIDKDRSTKGPDFASRITFEVDLRYQTLTENGANQRAERDIRLEQIYFGTLLIRRLYPDIRRIRLGVLAQFYAFEPKVNPAREIRREVHRLANLRYGGIERHNWQGDWVDQNSFKDKGPVGNFDFDDWIEIV